MSSPYHMHYADFSTELQLPGGLPEFDFEANPGHPWGQYREKNVALRAMRFYEASANLHRPFRIAIDHNAMPDEVHLCAVLRGNVQGAFCGNKLLTNLSNGYHHYLYAPHEQYTLTFQDVHYLHVAIDRQYYIRLLQESCDWFGQLRGQLVRREPVHERNVPLHTVLRPLVAGMLHTPLPDSLRDMMLEARALELIALQLDLYRGTPGRESSCRKDKDLFLAIRDYLSQTFLEEHSLQALAREFGINEFKLKQGFRHHTGTTVFGFLFEARMTWAYQCLKFEDRDVRTVATLAGYKNANHFSAAFKRRFGVSRGRIKSK